MLCSIRCNHFKIYCTIFSQLKMSNNFYIVFFNISVHLILILQWNSVCSISAVRCAIIEYFYCRFPLIICEDNDESMRLLFPHLIAATIDTWFNANHVFCKSIISLWTSRATVIPPEWWIPFGTASLVALSVYVCPTAAAIEKNAWNCYRKISIWTTRNSYLMQ